MHYGQIRIRKIDIQFRNTIRHVPFLNIELISINNKIQDYCFDSSYIIDERNQYTLWLIVVLLFISFDKEVCLKTLSDSVSYLSSINIHNSIYSPSNSSILSKLFFHYFERGGYLPGKHHHGSLKHCYKRTFQTFFLDTVFFI